MNHSVTSIQIFVAEIFYVCNSFPFDKVCPNPFLPQIKTNVKIIVSHSSQLDVSIVINLTFTTTDLA